MADTHNSRVEIKDEEEDCMVDRISELPEFIIHHILSFLKPPIEVIRTSVLSKKWYHSIYSTLPKLCFSEVVFCKGMQWKSEERINFLNFVDTSLTRYHSNKFRISSFHFDISHIDAHVTSFINKWIRVLAQNQVKELSLDLLDSRRSENYVTLPPSFFSTYKMLKTLSLYNFRIESSCMERIAFGCLQDIHLGYVRMQDEKILNYIISSCPLLETITLCYCQLKEIQVYGLPKLRTVKVVDGYDSELTLIDINALSLQSFTFCGSKRDYVPRIEVTTCKNLKDLTLGGIDVVGWSYIDFISQFPRLQVLTLTHCVYFRKIKISSNCLLEVNIREVRLASFEYTTSSPMPRISLPNNSIKWEAYLGCYRPAHNNTFLRLREFVSKSKRLEILTLWISFEQPEVNLDELSDIFSNEDYELKHLKLDFQQLSSNYAAVLDGILWCCRPRMVSFTMTNYQTNSMYLTDFITHIYEKLSHRAHTWCVGNHMECWNHHVKNVVIEILDPVSTHRTPTELHVLLDTLPTIENKEIYFRLNWLVLKGTIFRPEVWRH